MAENFSQVFFLIFFLSLLNRNHLKIAANDTKIYVIFKECCDIYILSVTTNYRVGRF